MINFWKMLLYALKRKQTFPPNPPYIGNIPPGIGRTVPPPYKFKTLEMYKYYWKYEVGNVSKNIHKTP